jgi:hypothetical protein
MSWKDCWIFGNIRGEFPDLGLITADPNYPDYFIRLRSTECMVTDRMMISP